MIAKLFDHTTLMIRWLAGMAFVLTGNIVFAQTNFDVLVFSRTTEYRHESIPNGIRMIEELGRDQAFSVTSVEDPDVFSAETLDTIEVVIFLNTSGDILNAKQQDAFEEFIRNGGGFVGIHGASATEYDWSWYGQLVGSFFKDHPKIQRAELTVVDRDHISTRHLPARWTWRDEWYNFDRPLPDGLKILITIDENTYSGGSMGDPHPIAWLHEFDGGRSFYTALGHIPESYDEALFREHVLGGILWAAGATD